MLARKLIKFVITRDKTLKKSVSSLQILTLFLKLVTTKVRRATIVLVKSHLMTMKLLSFSLYNTAFWWKNPTHILNTKNNKFTRIFLNSNDRWGKKSNIKQYGLKYCLSLHHFYPFIYWFSSSSHLHFFFTNTFFSHILCKSTEKPHCPNFKWQLGLCKE